VISLPSLPLVPPEAIAAVFVVCGIILAINLIFSMLGLKFPSSSNPAKKKREVKK